MNHRPLPSIERPDRMTRAVVFVDLFESVRLMEADEDDTVLRWRQLVDCIEHEILPAHEGRLVKSLGDGLLLEFPRVAPSVAAAFAIQKRCDDANADAPPARRMLLRMGEHVGALIADAHDVYGQSVNLAARLTTLAGPGEIVVSAAVRDELTPVLDADIEDLGDCYLKHVSQPVRAYRISPPGAHPVIVPPASALELRPVIAVIPFASRDADPRYHLLGELLADEVISGLSQCAELHVISRLSTTAFRERSATLAEVGAHLHAHYVLSGAYRVARRRAMLTVELADARTEHVVWSNELAADVARVLRHEDDLIERIVAETSRTIIAAELQRAQARALPTLEGYTLLLSAIALMHRLSLADFDRAREMLQALIDRVPRQAVPYAWLAKWHVLRVQQGWAEDPRSEAALALECTKRVLELDARCALALTIHGFVHTNLLKQFDAAAESYDLALSVNPNESLAWLLKGTLHAFKGEGAQAVEGTSRALRLSPLDPLRYFYDSLSATAAMSAGHYEQAIAFARSSLRLNRTHTSTYRALAISQWQLGRHEDARRSVAELMRLEPSLTVSKWLERSPSSAFATGRMWSDALRQAGMPG
ncbi:MAG TPA: adenylate/guanylate cyclase domain-containing protein [Casimicrobiaceae bacterium]